MTVNCTSQKLLILTETERVEGTVRHAQAIRVSDYFNAGQHRDTPFINVCDATVTCLRTGEVICRDGFVMLARQRVTLVVPLDGSQVRAGGRTDWT
jgi:hypothetical protein